MRCNDVLVDAFTRVVDQGVAVVDGLTREQLTWTPSPPDGVRADANPIAWLVWHAARVQDDHLATLAGVAQVWTAEGFVERFALPLDPGDIGFGHTAEQVHSVVADAPLLAEYLRAVHAQTVRYLDALTDADLGRIVDTRWDPPVTLGVRLVSVINDDTQHLGQAAYLRGLQGLDVALV